MKTRILKAEHAESGVTRYVPQYEICEASGRWLEFIGYEITSPYLQPRSFKTEKEAFDFLLQPSIYKVGKTDWGTVTTVVSQEEVSEGNLEISKS